MSGQPMNFVHEPIATGRVTRLAEAAIVARPATEISPSESSERAARYAAEAVANAETAHRHSIERRLHKPTRRWTARELVRTYRANESGERQFREEAEVLTRYGYAGWLETERAGHPFGGRLLVAVGLGASAGRDAGRHPRWRTVTWVREQSGDARTPSSTDWESPRWRDPLAGVQAEIEYERRYRDSPAGSQRGAIDHADPEVAEQGE
jgi:hypothetical protein